MSWIAFRLYEMHRRIDEEIRMQQHDRFANPIRIMRLKKLKLAIKDRLSALARHPGRA